MIPAKHDFKVWRGTAGASQGLVVRLRATDPDNPNELVPVPWQDVRLSIYRGKTLIRRLSILDSDPSWYVSDAYGEEFTWAPTAAQTREIPQGKKASYELEVWNGPDSEVVYMYGAIEGLGGINDDQEDEVS